MNALAFAVSLLALASPRGAPSAATMAMAWNDCRDGFSSGTIGFSCSSNTQTFDLVPSFTLDAPADSVLSMEFVIDVSHSDVALPDWWRLDPGQCRQGQATASGNLSTLSCADPWNGLGVAGVQGYLPSVPFGAPNHARLLVAVTTSDPAGVTLSQGVTYAPVRVQLHTGNSVNPPAACAGCLGAACLVLNSIQIHRVPAASQDGPLVTVPVAAGANWVYWQSSSGSNCAAVPVRRRTWGEIKSLYR